MDWKPQDLNAQALAAAAARAPTIQVFLRVAGRLLSTSTLQVERLFLSLRTLHPAPRGHVHSLPDNREVKPLGGADVAV